MTLLNMNIVIDNVVKFCYEIQLLWNAMNPLKCKCGYNYRANMTLSNLIGCNARCSWDEWLIDSLPVPRGTRGAVAASLAQTNHRFYALLLPRWKYVWPLKAALWSTKLLSKHVDYCRACVHLWSACVHKWLAASSSKIFYGYKDSPEGLPMDTTQSYML